jgi:nucleoside-diphosphate-sugar epimerase
MNEAGSMTDPGRRVIVTGGSGKVGRYIIQDLAEHGYEVLNVDRQALDPLPARTLITDVTDPGQVFNALSSYTGREWFPTSLRPRPICAVVHLAAILLAPDNEVFRVNVLGTYNVLDAATTLGIPKVILAVLLGNADLTVYCRKLFG